MFLDSEFLRLYTRWLSSSALNVSHGLKGDIWGGELPGQHAETHDWGEGRRLPAAGQCGEGPRGTWAAQDAPPSPTARRRCPQMYPSGREWRPQWGCGAQGSREQLPHHCGTTASSSTPTATSSPTTSTLTFHFRYCSLPSWHIGGADEHAHLERYCLLLILH